MSELKPCPFCGGEADKLTSSDGFTSIGCLHCNPLFGVMVQAPTEAEAAAVWNMRHVETCRNVNKEWSKTSFAHAGTSFCCSECGAHYVDAESYYAGLADKDEEQIRTNYCPNCGREVKR